MSRVRNFVSVLVLALAGLGVAGCRGLAQALGANPAATAPAYNGIGLIAQPGAEVKVYGSPNQSGPVGASGSASGQAEQVQTTEIGAEAIDALLSAAQDALRAGAAPVASTLIDRAKALGGAKKAGPSRPQVATGGDRAPPAAPTAPPAVVQPSPPAPSVQPAVGD
jgi:hypothetical protein